MKERQITLHLEADTKLELSVLTVAEQERWNMTLEFFDFSQTKDGKWVCWYQVPHKKWAQAVVNGQA